MYISRRRPLGQRLTDTATTTGTSISELRAGMDVQSNEGRRPWYRILNIDAVGGDPRWADVEALGGKNRGELIRMAFYSCSAGYVVREPAVLLDREDRKAVR